MSKKLLTFLVLSLFLLSVVGTATVFASSSLDKKVSRSNVYNFKSTDSQPDMQARGKFAPAASLGSFSADGRSPGYIIGRSWKDDQAHLTPSRMVGWGGNSPVIHFTFTNQPGCAGADNVDVCARFLHYNFYDPTVPPNGEISSDGIPVQTNPLAVGGMYASADIDETGHMIITGERFNSPEGADAIKRVGVFWDNGGPGTYGLFIGDTLPNEDVVDERYKQPEIEYQEFGGSYITHIISVTGYGPIDQTDGSATRQLTYWRKVNAASGSSGTWTSMVFEDTSWCDQYSMGCEHDGGGNVGIAWVRWRDPSGGSDYGSHIFIILSDDAGATWSEKVDIIPWNYETNSWQPWVECSALMDHEGYFHVVWNANEYSSTSHSASGIDPARLFHWTNRVAGSAAGGSTSLIQVADFEGLGDMCGRGESNVLNLGHAVVSECNNRLYTTWVQYGDLENGDTSDCADDALAHDLGTAYNADVFMSVSLTLDGSLWDAARNLTNSKSKDCDTTAGNECDDDNYPSVSRYGMNNADFGTLYWAAAPEAFTVADALDPSYSDGYYLDVQFVDDLVPAPARYVGDAAIWSYDPIKWFRLPCVPPVVEPRIFISQDDFIHPVYWVKSGQEKIVDVLVENIGNDLLNVTNVSANYIQGGSGWLNFAPTSFTIDAASSDYVQVTINPGGTINPPAGTAVAIEADVVFTSNDPKKPNYAFQINTVVADTVVQIMWDTVATGKDVALAVSNQGGAGFVGIGRANLDFVRPSIDCDSAQTVYLYDMTPVVMSDLTHYSYNPYWSAARSDVYNFQPVKSEVKKKSFSGSVFDGYNSDKFVNADSTIALVKYWYAPIDNVSYVVERIDIESFDGNTHTGVHLGEWIDWDVPSDTASNNQGGISANPGSVDYVYQQGLEYEPGVQCTDNDRRFAASGLLGYYTKSEYDTDENVNHTGLYGGFVQLKADMFETSSDVFIPDSVWAFLNRNELSANNSDANDQTVFLSFGTFDIGTDPLTIFLVHATVYDGDETDLQSAIDAAESWYTTNRDEMYNPGCCGKFTGGYTGNTDCDSQGKMALSDITKLIDRVYLSKQPLCCEENGNVDGDSQGKMALSDITKLIDHVYLSKQPTALCQ